MGGEDGAGSPGSAGGAPSGGMDSCLRRKDGWRGVEDLQATLDKAESLGSKTTMPIMEVPGMVTLAHFSDPDGNVIGIVQSAG